MFSPGIRQAIFDFDYPKFEMELEEYLSHDEYGGINFLQLDPYCIYGGNALHWLVHLEMSIVIYHRTRRDESVMDISKEYNRESKEERIKSDYEILTRMGKLLIDKGINVNCFNNVQLTPLDYIFIHNRDENLDDLVIILINSGSNLNSGNGPCPSSLVFQSAIECGYTNVCKLLIERGVDVNQANSSQIKPLILAINCNRAKIVKLLIDSGADVTLKDENGMTSLHHACIKGNIDSCRIILSTNSTEEFINAEDVDKVSCLYFILERLDIKEDDVKDPIVELLISHGVNFEKYLEYKQVQVIVMKKEIERLHDKIRELWDRPPQLGGPGYEECKSHFESVANGWNGGESGDEGSRKMSLEEFLKS